ncbi:unnamed protein product [Caenorhabditis brenneri]
MVQEASGCFACQEGFVIKIGCTKNVSGPASLQRCTFQLLSCRIAKTVMEIHGKLENGEKFELEEPDEGRRHSRSFFENSMETIAAIVNRFEEKLYMALGQMVALGSLLLSSS